MTKHHSIPARVQFNTNTGLFDLSIQLDEDQIIQAAHQILEQRFTKLSEPITSPEQVKDFLLINMANQEREVFACLFLDKQGCIICFETLFYGSLCKTNINHPLIIKRAFTHNASGVIAVHNHPSGSDDPSPKDIGFTRALRKSLGYFDIQLLDHFVVGFPEISSIESILYGLAWREFFEAAGYVRPK